MQSIKEVKTEIQKCVGKGCAFYPQLYFVGKIGDKTHAGTVHLFIDKVGRLSLWGAHVNCGSKKWAGRSPSVSNLTGKALVTCQRCDSAGKVIDLDARNEKYRAVIPFIGKVI